MAARQSFCVQKNSGSVITKVPPIQLRVLSILFFLTFSVDSTNCQKCFSVNMTVATFPEGDINVLYGNSLEIYCRTEVNSAENLTFTLAGSALESTRVNDTTIRLFIEKPDIQRKTYYCINNVTKRKCLNSILVDTAPKTVNDFKCISHNLESMKCTWTSLKSLSDISYNLTFNNNGAIYICPVDRDEKIFFCELTMETILRYKPFYDMYYFNLVGCNIFGCNSQNITIDHYSIVKPEPPINFQYKVTGPHSVLLTWNISYKLVDYLKCGVLHKIEYQIAKVDNPKYFRQINVTGLPTKNLTYKFELTNLPYAYMRYEVRVYIKSNKAVSDEFWSSFVYVVFRTKSEIPHRPPEMPAGAFYITPYTNRMIYIYWKQLEEYEECGDNFTYLVSVKQDDKASTLLPEKTKSLSYVVLKSTSRKALVVSVKSMNSKGPSVNSSYLHIPPHSKILEGSTSFTKLAYANGTYELSWDINFQNIDNYTLFWCRYNWTQVCVGRLNYTLLEPHKKNHVIDLPSDQRYQFAISVNRGDETSGMVWAKCDIFKDAANYDIPVHLDYESPVNSSVVIKWKLECTLRDGIVIGYKINYCPIIQTGDLCDNTVGNKSIEISDPTTKSVNITNLLYHRTYQFGFVLITTNGPIDIKDATTRVTTPEGTPSSPVNITISNITHDSLVISYDPPAKKNGHIVVYIIYNYDKVFFNDTAGLPDPSGKFRRQVKLSNLKAFTQYSWSVQACNKHCSKIDTLPISMRTSIGPPGKIRPPKIMEYSPDVLDWTQPNEFGGNTKEILYQIKRVRDGKDVQIFNSTTTSIKIKDTCDGVIAYQVRAVNFDDDYHHGACCNDSNVFLPYRNDVDVTKVFEYPGEWSDPPATVNCRGNDNLDMILPIMVLLAILIGLVFGLTKLYRVHKNRENIKIILPGGLSIPEPEVTTNKFVFSAWNPIRKEEKEEKLLLGGYTKPNLPSPEIKVPKGENSGASDHTDSTIISDTTRGPLEREASTSLEGSDCSLDGEPIKLSEKCDSAEDTEVSSEGASTPEQSLLLTELDIMKFAKPIVDPTSGYVKSDSMPQTSTLNYVRAGLESSSFSPNVPSETKINSAYVPHENMQTKSFMNFPQLGASPTRPFESENLPIIPSLSSIVKNDANSFQLQNLNTLPITKPVTINKGYVTVNNVPVTKPQIILADSSQGVDDPAILDHSVMSPDAYCRFSWNVNPANDNLNALHADSPTNQCSRN